MVRTGEDGEAERQRHGAGGVGDGVEEVGRGDEMRVQCVRRCPFWRLGGYWLPYSAFGRLRWTAPVLRHASSQ